MRLRLLFAVAVMAGTAATMALAAPPHQSSPARPAPMAAATARNPSVDGQQVQVGWLAAYGRYNVRHGSWSLLPTREGC